MTRSSHSYPVLGESAIIRVLGPPLPDATVEPILRRWAALEDRFDPSRSSSELSLIASGRSSMQHASAEFRAAHADAIRWRNQTRGSFRSHGPGGVLNLRGLGKAYAIRDAAMELGRGGPESWLIELGGDAMSDALGSGAWTAGIADPVDDTQLLTAIPLGGSWTTVATARAADPRHAGDFVQATVLGRDIVVVHALAASVVTGGAAAFDLAIARWPVDVLAVDGEGRQRSTPRLRRHVRRSSEGSRGADGTR